MLICDRCGEQSVGGNMVRNTIISTGEHSADAQLCVGEFCDNCRKQLFELLRSAAAKWMKLRK